MQSPEVILLLAFPLMLVAVLVTTKRRRKSLNDWLKVQWGSKASQNKVDMEMMPGIAAYWRMMRAPANPCEQVDDVTWNDLDMDALYAYLNRAQSNVGEAALYAIMREIDADNATLSKRHRWMQAISADEAKRLIIQKQLHKMGRDHSHNAYTFMNSPETKTPSHAWVYYLLAVLPIFFLASGFLNPVFFLGIGLSFMINVITYTRTHAVWETEVAAVQHLSGVIHTARRILKKPVAGMEDVFSMLHFLCSELKPISRWNSFFAMARVSNFDVLTDYLRIAFQLDMISLSQLAAFVKKHKEGVAQLYALVGEIDACIAIASVRASLKQYTVPEFTEGREVLMENMIHPLIAHPVPNSIHWKENALVTGSNASGKSTFIKALALNAICAQTICTCWAERMRLPRTQVLSSMALRDQVLDGESYFVVEIKSLRRILSSIRSDRMTLCFVDEILRGTNTVERIASSASLLEFLSGQPALCIAATHDIELTQLLPNYEQYHFREDMSPEGMTFSYRLMDGPSFTRNAILLLEQMDFPAQVILKAEQIAERFIETGKWRTF